MMRISSEYSSSGRPDLLKLASKDASRPVLTALYLDVDAERGSYIVGTDSYKLGAVPVDVHPADVSGLVPAEAIKAWQQAVKGARGVGAGAYGPELVCTAGEVRLEWGGAVQVWTRPEGQYPAWRQLIPEEVSTFKVTLSAKLLLELAAGLGAEAVTLEFCRSKEYDSSSREYVFGDGPSNLRPIVVHNGSHGERAVLMPIRLAG